MAFRNLPEMLRRQAGCLGRRPAIRFKRHGLFHDVTWRRYHDDVLACAAALVESGVGIGDRVGLLAENRVEWLIADLGILAAGAVTVPLHAPLTAAQARFQLADAGVSRLFVSTPAQLDKIRTLRPELPTLGRVILMEAHSAEDAEAWPSFLGRGRRAWAKHGETVERMERSLGPEDLATVIYTSGTTGNPKGVMLTHGNLVSNAWETMRSSNQGPDGLVLNWLPLSHIFARTVDHYGCLAGGVTLALAPSAETVVENLAELHPTRMAAVPRFYEKVLSAVASTEPGQTARRLRDVFGPRIKWLCSGGAPLPRPVEDAYRAAGLPILPGYGLTESSPVISFSSEQSYKPGSVGLPLRDVEVRIARDGEILCRGPNVMRGYWNNPEATAEALSDGWLLTGDLGRLDEEGFLYITGRKKELLVLSNGKKVVPSYLEGLLIAEPAIDQAVICGEGKNYLTALLVPNWEHVRRSLQSDHAALQSFLREAVDRALVNVAPWEQVKRFAVLPEPLTVAADELTVSLKLRRSVVLEKHRAAWEALYE
jgi:long-chain acyl-CoA synthetase